MVVDNSIDRAKQGRFAARQRLHGRPFRQVERTWRESFLKRVSGPTDGWRVNTRATGLVPKMKRPFARTCRRSGLNSPHKSAITGLRRHGVILWWLARTRLGLLTLDRRPSGPRSVRTVLPCKRICNTANRSTHVDSPTPRSLGWSRPALCALVRYGRQLQLARGHCLFQTTSCRRGPSRRALSHRSVRRWGAAIHLGSAASRAGAGLP